MPKLAQRTDPIDTAARCDMGRPARRRVSQGTALLLLPLRRFAVAVAVAATSAAADVALRSMSG